MSNTRFNPEDHKEKRGVKKVLLVFVGLMVSLLLIVGIVLFSTPQPVALVVRSSFENPNITQAKGYQDVESRVTIEREVVYPSQQKDNVTDVYRPRQGEGPFPVVLWVHGGAYVGGDKNDIRNYAAALAANGYVVFSMNYRRAPEAKYPSPILQIGEMYEFMEANREKYRLDMSNIALAGDSAGAHMVSAFLTVQTSPDYAKMLGIDPVVPTENIKAALLYCGPYDIERLAQKKNGVTSFILGRAAWAYFGEKNWGKTHAEQTTMTRHVTKDFPPAFITDGNTASFEQDGRDLAAILTSKNVPVESYFIPLEEEVTKHEYQFLMDTPAGEKVFAKTLDFLNKHMHSQPGEVSAPSGS